MRVRCGSAIPVTVLLAAHVALLAWSAERHSPTFNEVGHVPAGISHWRYRVFELYRVNPPLPRMVATFPLLFYDVKTAWSNYGLSPFSREEIPMGIRFAEANGSRTFRIFTIARWACIPFCLLGAWTCYLWASELWGSAGGLVALLLWCGSPFILGHGPLVMPDVPAAALGLTASYLFWTWLRGTTWSRAALTGLALGAALLCKTTLLLFLGTWPLLWLIFVTLRYRKSEQTRQKREVAQFAAMLAVALYIVNLGYGFKNSFQQLGDFQFLSRTLTGWPATETRNRFTGTWLGSIPVPVPADYLQGIDRQRADFELGERSYLRGQWRQDGWWYYHLYGLAIKTPLGTLLLIATAAVTTFRQRRRTLWCDELCLLLPATAILTLVSSQTGFSNHVRYTIPALPFLFIWAAKCALAFPLRQRFAIGVVVTGVAWTLVSSLLVYPHSLSYFNGLVGGPKNGHRHLLDSNIAWGQDLLLLREWLAEHPEARPVQITSFGWIDPRLAGIEFALPPAGPQPDRSLPRRSDSRKIGPLPGWYAIDVNFLHGTHWPAANGDGAWTDIPPDGPNYEYFRLFEPVDRVGYSTHIYYITRQQADEARRSLGLPPTPDGIGSD